MTNLQIFNYQGNNVTFHDESGIIYINATQMAKPFDKRPNDYLNLQSTKDLVEVLHDTIKNGNDDTQVVTLVITEKGGIEAGGGTWLHEDLAIDFAQWLSISFRVWVNARIKELLQKGYVKLDGLSKKAIAQMVIELEEEKERLELENSQYQDAFTIASPKIIFADAVTNCDGTISIGELAKLIKQNNRAIGRNRLFDILRRAHILDKKNIPYQDFMNREWFILRESIVQSGENYSFPRLTVRVTGKGQQAIIRMFLDNGKVIDPLIKAA
jgi:phage antirepressor YoqD-like protein